ncbi:hypothetical protein GS8_601 [Geobacillus stearothermophilus]|uniref:Uncharacterized protein n=1 Tax=Geobacillus stearothermophilus TaxID=1422 RepID=A0ABQ7HJ99_GEOSE|nr:hypothetical protein GS8_601 [Geobacillus stearothermophilus]
MARINRPFHEVSCTVFYIILPMNAKMENRKIDQETAGKTLRGGGFLLK